MAAENHDERFQQHAEMIQGLARMFAAQHDFNQRVTLAIERIEQTLAEVKTMQADMKNLLARMIEQGTNGREA